MDNHNDVTRDRRYLSPQERDDTRGRFQTDQPDEGAYLTVSDLVDHAELMDELVAAWRPVVEAAIAHRDTTPETYYDTDAALDRAVDQLRTPSTSQETP